MPNSLKDFYLNEVMRNDVKEYLIQFLKEEAIGRLLDEDSDAPTYGFAEAKTIIEKAFNNLEVLFSPKVKEKEQYNEAR